MFPFDPWMLPWSGQGNVNTEVLSPPDREFMLQAYTYLDCECLESSYVHFVNWGAMGTQPTW